MMEMKGVMPLPPLEVLNLRHKENCLLEKKKKKALNMGKALNVCKQTPLENELKEVHRVLQWRPPCDPWVRGMITSDTFSVTSFLYF
jgi:hypothetical protein